MSLHFMAETVEETGCKSPIITDINWIENGKIKLSFEFNCSYLHKIQYYEIYYCYINNNDNNWHKYVQNHWRNIHIASQNKINKDIELRIATFKDIYDENKNKNIELLLKIRCELKHNDWNYHKFYCEFSNIYFVRSLSIPSIIIKQTQIEAILNVIAGTNNKYTDNDKQIAKNKLFALYESFKSIPDVINTFTHLLIKYIQTKYQNKCNKLLINNKTLTLPAYLIQIEKYLNDEKQHLLRYIEKYCNKQNILCLIMEVLLDLKNNNKISQFLKDEKKGIINLFIKLFAGQHKEDIDRLMTFCDYMNKETRSIFNEHICMIHSNYLSVNPNANELLIKYIREYYKTKSRVWMDQLNCSQYLIKAEACIQNEEKLACCFYDKNRVDGIFVVTRDQLLKWHQDELLSKSTGINSILQRAIGEDVECAKAAKHDLDRMYRLYSCVPGGNGKIAQLMKDFLCNLQRSYITKSKEAKDSTTTYSLIPSFISLHDNFLRIVKEQFYSEQVFHKALKEAFEEFINMEYYTSALLARFASNVLTNKHSLPNMIDLENTMDHIVMLYGYVRDKDIFERDYQHYLANRLLCNSSISEQAERSMIGKLKTESGYHWTSMLEDMFKDIQRSKELVSNFYTIYNESEYTLNVSICTKGAWPISKTQCIKEPIVHDVMRPFETFKQFFVKKYYGSRQLDLLMNQGNAEMLVQFNAKTKKILVVSSLQMLILLLFNNKNVWTYKEIEQVTGIKDNELKNAILSMAHPKVKVLRKKPNTKEIENDHKFSINSGYSKIGSKIEIPTLNIFSTQETDDMDYKEMEAIYRKRRHQMDAVIIRVMASHKILGHQELVIETVEQLRGKFTPKSVDIKKRVANLIELEYMERDENDRQLYHYKR